MTAPIRSRSRRRLLGNAVASIVGAGFMMLGLQVLRRPVDREAVRKRVDQLPDYRFRPPGAMPEPQFLARCIHCGICQDVCPADCIQMALATGSDYETPYVTPRIKGCTLCRKCGEVCPTGALLPVVAKADVRMGVARVDEELCVSHLRTGACGACFTVCPLRGKAITQGLFNAPTVHPDYCTGCGLCEEICIVPYRAIRVRPVNVEENVA